jgi:hypothetical protein
MDALGAGEIVSVFDENIGYSRDKDGNDEPFSLKDVYHTLIEMTKIAYFNFMINCIDADFEGFKTMHHTAMEKIMKVIHDTYADHVEGARVAKERGYNG